MKGIRDFIIKLDKPLNETFKTEKGVEIYAHQDFSVDRLSNRVAKVMATPMFIETPIEVGYEVMIEPTILYKQIYRGVKQGYTSLIDKDDNLFKVTPNMIILYRKDENDTWKGHLQNLMVEQIKEEEPVIKTSLLLPENSKPKFKKGVANVLYVNAELESMGVKNGDELSIDPAGGVNFWLDGKHYWWIRTRDVYGKMLQAV
ncbi:hypothetical protein [Thalassobellus suaedae]|uniref:Uncharacterized protein n=1 Tax=Thalassobellus suaedae TaxID=3074124 RepID=A0ABY9XWP6_9FLAO|nr:hypothetical protein RHP51_04950 [Flavobacteriaceae bacterium HL-DH14]